MLFGCAQAVTERVGRLEWYDVEMVRDTVTTPHCPVCDYWETAIIR